MKSSCQQNGKGLENGATVAVIGGGPAGAFSAIHLLRQARALQRDIQVVIFERRRQLGPGTAGCPATNWKGCNYCAGGLSPKLLDLLAELNLRVPEEVVQGRIRFITIEGYWKNIEFEVPEGREILTVYRGSRPATRRDRHQSFDSFLLDQALAAGARLISAEVDDVRYGDDGRPQIHYHTGATREMLDADFAVCAAGVNEVACASARPSPVLESLRRLIPGFVPPRLRQALIFELEVDPHLSASLEGQLHFVEYGSKALRLEMCSLVPKRGYVTAVLMGESVDSLSGHAQNAAILRQFLELPHIRKLMPPTGRLRVSCSCNPNMVVSNARNPISDRIAVVGDMATSRLYKDGILSAHQTARALAETLLNRGSDREDLIRGYLPTLRRFQRDNRFAAVVFLLHRIVFGSSMLSRVFYQAVITERKDALRQDRRLKRILWQIASGDAYYEDVFLSIIHPATLWRILTGGLLITLRNYLTESVFGLRWEGFGRFTTGVARERFDAKRAEFARLFTESGVAVPSRPEFERMYTIRILAPRDQVLDQLGRFGEPDRRYFRPRWVRVERTSGTPNEPGCVIRYTVVSRHFQFHLVLEEISGGHLVVYRVRDGFARDGVLIFEIEKVAEDICTLSIYLAFDFNRGRTGIARPFWFLFRLLFPAYVHDVIWNHSLCVFKDVVESDYEAARKPAPVEKPPATAPAANGPLEDAMTPGGCGSGCNNSA